MARRFIRPTVTIIALAGLVAVGTLYYAPAVTEKLFSGKAVAVKDTPVLSIQPIVAGDQIPADQLGLEILAASLKAEQDEQAKSLSTVTPAAGDTK